MHSVTLKHISPEIKAELMHIYKRAIVLHHLIKVYKEKKLASKSPFERIGAGTVEKLEEAEVDRQPMVTDITFYFEQTSFEEANAFNPEAADGYAPRKVASGLSSKVLHPKANSHLSSYANIRSKIKRFKNLLKNNERDMRHRGEVTPSGGHYIL